jgi:hypothetical protein
MAPRRTSSPEDSVRTVRDILGQHDQKAFVNMQDALQQVRDAVGSPTLPDPVGAPAGQSFDADVPYTGAQAEKLKALHEDHVPPEAAAFILNLDEADVRRTFDKLSADQPLTTEHMLVHEVSKLQTDVADIQGQLADGSTKGHSGGLWHSLFGHHSSEPEEKKDDRPRKPFFASLDDRFKS